MDATNEVVTVSASNATKTATIQTPTNAFNVNQSNNNAHTHAHTHSGSNTLINKTTSNVISSSSSNICIGGSSNNSSSCSSNSNCSSSSTSSNSSGYGSTTTTPTNNYDLQQTTPTTTPVPTTPVGIPEHIIPIATVAAVTPFYNESLTTHNLETHHVQHQRQHPQQQLQPQPHHMLQTNHHHQFSQNHLQTNQQQQQQYLPRQQYYSPYDYQQTAPTHNLVDGPGTLAVAPYNVIIPGSYEMSSPGVAPAYGAGQYKSLSSAGATNYERNSEAKAVITSATYNHQQQQQQQQQQLHLQGEQQHSKPLNQQAQQQTGVLAATKQRSSSSSLISNSTSINTSKPQAAATPFYANPTPIYDNYKHKIPLEYHDTYNNPLATTAATYHQQQKYYAAAKSQLKEATYGSPTGVNNKSLYPNAGNYFPGSTGSRNLPTSYEKFMYSHTSATDYSTSGHLSNETPPEVSNYRKPAVENAMNSPSWPWGIDYASGNSRSIPPPASHLPTATVAPTHATHLPQNPSVIARDPYYMGHDNKYSMRYDKYGTPSYQQPYGSPPANRHLWSNIPHAPNLTQLNERHILATGSSALPTHGLHATPYFPNNSSTALNSRQSCCSQPYQPQSCYYPPLHPVPTRLHHNQTPTVVPPTGGYLPAQQQLGQSTHLNALSASCKYGGVLPDCGNGNKMKNTNDLYLNIHHYDNNPAPHNFAYGSGHNSQQLYAANGHQSMAHGNTPASLLTNDPLNANPTSYTNDLSLTTSNFDNYHTHLNTHPAQQTLPGFPNQQPPPAYGPTVAKRALLDYRKPIQPQNPTAISEDCYTTLNSRDHYNQQELLNTPETTTSYGEYEAHQGKLTTLSTISHPSAVIADPDRGRDESNKNLSLRDFIANWNDDEDEYQNNEEINFDQNNVIAEVLQAAPVEREAAVLELDDTTATKPPLLDSKNNEECLKESANSIESLVTTLNDPETNQYNNLPDIVIDIEKSNNVSNSTITATTSLTPPTPDEASSTSLSLTNFDVEKELDELNLKKPVQQELTKDSNDIKDVKNMTTPQLSPCRNLTNQLSFEDLQLESGNNTVLNAIATRLTNNHSSELNDQYFKDIEGYESSCSRHSNESAFEKEYETFINKITSETCATKGGDAKATDAEKEIDFVQNVHDFSKFYKRKRKLKEVEPKTLVVPANQSQKRLKTAAATKVNNSNFPQVYTKKSRNRANKVKLQSLHKRNVISPYYKIIHSIRRFGLYREKRVREYMAELKEKHLPLIKRQSIKNYTHIISESLFNAQSLKALCLMAINTEEFRKLLLLTMVGEQEKLLETEEKHICIDPTCETCEVIKSLMEAESFETTLTENNDDNTLQPATMFCVEGNSEPIAILQNTPNTIDLNIRNEEHIMISREIENAQYSKENFPAFDTKDLEKTVVKSFFHETNMGVENWHENSKSPKFDLQAKDCFETSSQPAFETAKMTNLETSLAEIDNITPEEVANPSRINEAAFRFKETVTVESELVTENNLPDDDPSNLNVNSKNVMETASIISIKNKDPLESSATEKDQESDSESESESGNSDCSESDTVSSTTDSEDKSVEDSRDSCKRSDSGNENNDTDIEDDLDDEDEIVHLDSNHSYQSQNISQNKNSENHTQNLELISKEDQRKDTNLNDIVKEQNDFIHTEDHSESDSEEDESISESPQRIVIRITKSLSPNDHSLRVENIFGKSLLKTHAEVINETDSETKDGHLEEAKSEISSDTENLSLKQGDDLQENIPEKPERPHTDNNLEDKNKKEIKSEILSAPLKLDLHRKDSIEDQAFEKPLDVDIKSDDNSQSEHDETELDEANSNLSPKPKAEICADEKSLKPNTASEYEAGDILEKKSSLEEPHDEHESNIKTDSEIIAIALKSTEKEEEETVELHSFEKIKESPLEFHESRDDLEKKSQVVSKSLKCIMKPEVISDNYCLDKFLESHNENNIKDIVLEKKSEIIFISSKSSENQEDQPFGNEADIKSIENSLKLNTMQESSIEIGKCLQSSACLIPTECEKIPKHIMEDNVDDLKESESIHKLPQIGPNLQAIDNDHGLENTTVLVYELENITENIGEEKETQKDHQVETGSLSDISNEINNEKSDSISSSLFEMNQNGEDIKESAEANIKTYNLLDSETEDEEAVQSDKEFYTEDEIQDSSSSYVFEYENDNDEILEPIKILNSPKTIIISDDESINSCDTDEDSLQQYENIKESEETKEPFDNEIQDKFFENSNKSLELDFEQDKHEKEHAAKSRWSFEEEEFSNAEINDTKQLFASSQSRQECDENNFNKYSLEDCDSAEASDDKAEEADNTSNHKIQNRENDDENIFLKCSKTSKMHEDISERILSKANQTSDCESKENSDLEQCNLQTFSFPQSNVLEKPLTLTMDSKTFNEKAETLQIFPDDHHSELETAEFVLEDSIENSNSLLDVNEVNSMKEYPNISYNSQNQIRGGGISDSSDETNSVQDQFDEITAKDKLIEFEESVNMENIDKSAIETGQNHNISQVSIEKAIANPKAIDNDPPVIMDNKDLESEETFAQLMPDDSEIPLEDESLVHSKSITEAVNLSETSVRKICDTSEDFDCKNNTAIEGSKTISIAKIMETDISEVTDLETKNTETFSNILTEDSNISEDINDQSQNENCNTINGQSSEATTKKSDDMDKVDDEETFEEISNQCESNAENESTEFETIFKDTKEKDSGSRFRNTLDESIEKISKTELKKAAIIPQANHVTADILEDQKLENSESSVDHIFIESISKPKSDDIEELKSKDLESIHTRKITESTVTTLRSEAEILEPVSELNNQILEESPKRLEFRFEDENIIIEDKKEEALKNLIDEDEPKPKVVSIVEEYEPIPQDITNQKSDEVIKISQDIEFIAKSPTEDLGNSSEKSNISKEESVEPFEGANEEFGAEINSVFNCDDSKHLGESKVSEEKEKEEEEAVVDLEVQPQTEFGKPSDCADLSQSFEEDGEVIQQTITHDNKLVSTKTEEATDSKIKQQTENPKSSLNETSDGNVLEKDCPTTEEVSEDSFGFRNQTSFEDESEDFHGFEDLEEVTRIRQEIENHQDDSTANDGFLNHLTLSRQMSKSPTTSLTESMSSDINELEALEREISQHQLEMREEKDDHKDHKETENELPTKIVDVVSSNDIEHIKQMLESDEEQPTDREEQKSKETMAHKPKDKSVEINKKNIPKDIITSVKSNIPKLSDLCRAALNSSLNSTSNFAQQHTETAATLAERELSVEEALAEMYRQAGVLLSDPEDCDNDIPSPRNNEARDVLLINLQEILNSDNNEVYVLQCDMNENVLNVVQSTEEVDEEKHQDNDTIKTERVNTVQFILDTENSEPQIHIISSDSESEVIILSDDESDFSFKPFTERPERITIPFINDGDDFNDGDISTIHHEEIVPDNLNKFLQEEFYKYLHEKYVQRNISKYYHANRVLKKYKKRFVRPKWQ